MRKLILLVALLTLVAFVSGAMAQQKPAPAPAKTAPAKPAPEKPKPVKMEKFSGVIEKVDEMAKAIEVKGKVKKEDKTLTFAINDKTKITKGGKDVPLAELKKGMHVSVAYKKDGEKMTATAIKVAGPKAAPKKETPKKEAPKK